MSNPRSFRLSEQATEALLRLTKRRKQSQSKVVESLVLAADEQDRKGDQEQRLERIETALHRAGLLEND